MSADATDSADMNEPWYRRLAAAFEKSLRRLIRPARTPLTKGLSVTPTQGALAVVGLLFGFVVVAFLVDAAAARGARHLPDWIVGTFDDLTDYGKSGWFLWPLAAALVALAFGAEKLSRQARLTVDAVAVRLEFLFVAIALPGLFTSIVKRFIGRARPFVGGDVSPFYFDPTSWKATFASFPSGHATTAAAVAVAVGLLWPRARTVVWIYAAIIFASRVVITAHYPTDVLGGALVGGGGALLVQRWFASRGRAFFIAENGRVVAFPGPSLRRVKAVARAWLAD